jgi:hypothetical protein
MEEVSSLSLFLLVLDLDDIDLEEPSVCGFAVVHMFGTSLHS